MSFLFNRADKLDLRTETVLPVLINGVMDEYLGDKSREYYLIRLAGFCDSDYHRRLLVDAEHNGHDAMAQVLDLMVKRRKFDIDTMRIKMGVLKVVMSFLGSPDLLNVIGVSKKVTAESSLLPFFRHCLLNSLGCFRIDV